MPGEKRGRLYEEVVGEGLRRAYPGRVISKQVPLKGSLIRSDFIIEPTKTECLGLVFVTHSGAETKTTQKFRRDIAELLQALRATNGSLLSIGVIFDSHVLRQLVDAEKAIFDKVIVADEVKIVELVGLNDSVVEAISMIVGETYSSLKARVPKNVGDAMEKAVQILAKSLLKPAPIKGMASKMNGLLLPTKAVPPKVAKTSKYYKGCAALMLVEPAIRPNLLIKAKTGALPASLPAYFYTLGGTARTAKIASPALVWVAKLMNHGLVVDSLNLEERPKASLYRGMLLACDFYPAFSKWLDINGSNAIAIQGLLDACFLDPSGTAVIVLGCHPHSAPKHNWAWTFLVALVREIIGKKQGFGAKVVAKITGNRKLCMQNSIISEYECCNKSLAVKDIASLSLYFSKIIGARKVLPPDSNVRRRLLHEVFVDKIGPHAVHPLPALVRKILTDAKMTPREEWVTTSVAEMAGATGNAGRVRLIRVKNTYIWCRSAQDGNEAHKTKEVGACIFGVTTQWDDKVKKINRKKSIKFIFVVDGEFDTAQLEFLSSCGVDVILRPEMLETQLAINII